MFLDGSKYYKINKKIPYQRYMKINAVTSWIYIEMFGSFNPTKTQNYMQQHGWTLKALCEVRKKIRHKTLYIIWFQLYTWSGIGKFMKTGNQLWFTLWRLGSEEWMHSGYGLSFQGDGNVLNWVVMMAAQHCKCTKSQ